MKFIKNNKMSHFLDIIDTFKRKINIYNCQEQNLKKVILKNLPLFLGVITIIISIIGFLTDLNMSLVETIYSTFGLFGGNQLGGDTKKMIQREFQEKDIQDFARHMKK